MRYKIFKQKFAAMKSAIKLLLLVTVTFLSASFKPIAIDPKDLIGAWGYGPENRKSVMIVTDHVFSIAIYDVPGKKMIGSYGGTWKIDNNIITGQMEWNSFDTTQAGENFTQEPQIREGKLFLQGDEGQGPWIRLDDGKPGALAGAWVITGNYRNDTVSKRASPFYPRRTMKVLSGKYFHWIAYNVVTKSFLNAGGGTYTTAKGKYTENIEFFTKTPASVGKSLSFDYSFVNGDWRHKGEKSTGGAMDECWSKRETLEK